MSWEFDPEVYRKWLVQTWVADSNYIRGCTEDEIRKVEELAGRPLPQCYVDFLRLCGRMEESDFWPNTYFTYSKLHEIANYCRDEETGELAEPLPPSSFVFAVTDIFADAFFFPLGHENPKVRCCAPYSDHFMDFEEPFGDFMAAVLQGSARDVRSRWQCNRPDGELPPEVPDVLY